MPRYRRYSNRMPKEPTKEQKQDALKRILKGINKAVNSIKYGINPPKGAKFHKAPARRRRGYTGNSRYGHYHRY